MGRKKTYKKSDVLEAIKGSNGIVLNVSKRLKCDWHTADNFIKKWPETLQALDDERESYLDLTESACIDRINAGDGQMIRFVLATLGKKRGYSTEERIEDNNTENDEPLQVICDGEEVDPQPINAEADA